MLNCFLSCAAASKGNAKRITDYIRQSIKGKDGTLRSVDIAEAIYNTREPHKSQRVAINRAIAAVDDGITITSLRSRDKGTRVVFNPLSEKSVLIAAKRVWARWRYIDKTDAQIWRKLDKKKPSPRMQLIMDKARDPENAAKIDAEFEAGKAARRAEFDKEFSALLRGQPTEADAVRAMSTLYDYCQAINDDNVDMDHEGCKLVFTITK